jgi:hypothetical protein
MAYLKPQFFLNREIQFGIFFEIKPFLENNYTPKQFYN